MLLTGLAAFLCASCNKVEEIFPESFHRNDNPFSVEKVPAEGGTIMLQRVNGGQTTTLDPESASFSVGDTLILTALPKNGYTFIKWVRDGKPFSAEPSFQFCLETEDLTDGKVKYHYEARFGLDYAIQSIPSIDKVIPAELIAEMGPYLHFGDNPPRIDTCFLVKIESISPDSIRPAIRLARFIHNLDDPTTSYYKQDSTPTNDQMVSIRFGKQHRCIAESALFVHSWGEIIPGNDFFEESTSDSVYIMGDGDCFTAYYRHKAKKRIEPDEELWAHMVTDFNEIREEWFIISGILTTQGIDECRIGTCVKGYSEPSDNIGVFGKLPAIHDIIIYDFPYDCFRYNTSN